MASERKTGAGPKLSGVLEGATPLRSVAEEELDLVDDGAEPDAAAGQGRGSARKTRQPVAKAPRKAKARTVYIPDDLFERILVQSHRRGKTISDYVVAILDRQVPDHRVIRPAEPPDAQAG